MPQQQAAYGLLCMQLLHACKCRLPPQLSSNLNIYDWTCCCCWPCCCCCCCCFPAGLAALTDLQHLTLSDLDIKQIPAASSDWFPVPGSMFSHLGRLTHLELDKCVASSTLEHLEHLTNLEELILGRLAVSCSRHSYRFSQGSTTQTGSYT